MIKGLYTAASGMMLQMSKQEITANNIANVSTCGYKKDRICAKAFPDMLISRLNDPAIQKPETGKNQTAVEIGKLGTGAVVDRVYTDYGQGNLVKTDNPLDLAINGEGYFMFFIDDKNVFSRDGRFHINKDDILVNYEGQAVLDKDNQEIYFNENCTINKNGEIYEDDEYITTLNIVTFGDSQDIIKQGNNFFTTEKQQIIPLENPDLLPGFQEISNVNAVEEMVNLISVMRSYESCQKVIQSEDEMLQKAINDVGRVV